MQDAHGCAGGCWNNSGSARASSPDTNGEQADAIVAKEMQELTVHERERVYEDVHGITDKVKETPELVERMIQEMEKYILQTPKPQRQMWERALFLKPSLEKDNDFKLMFIRAETYDTQKAAARICKYFRSKAELFGADKLVKDITLADLSKEDHEYLDSGASQFLKKKDAVGRVVWLLDSRNYDASFPYMSQARVTWYHIMAALEDTSAQMGGMACVYDFVDCKTGSLFDGERFSKLSDYFTKGMTKLIGALPIFLSGAHFCYNSQSLRPAMTLLLVASGKRVRLRFRTHFGSGLENAYALLGFGINIMHEKHAKSEYVAGRLELEKSRRLKAEQVECVSSLVAFPQMKDVLLERKKCTHHFGNQVFGRLIGASRARFHSLEERLEKTMMAIDVVQTIKASGGRFLLRSDDGWTIATDQVAKDRVYRALRRKDVDDQQPAAEASLNENPSNRTAPVQKKVRRATTDWGSA